MKSFVGHLATGLAVAALITSAVAAPKTTAASIKARQSHANAMSLARHERVLGALSARHNRVLHSEAVSGARHRRVLGALSRSHSHRLVTQGGIRRRQHAASVADLSRHQRVLSGLQRTHTARLRATKKR